MRSLWVKLMAMLKPARALSPTEVQARAMLKAIDAGGLPLNAARINDVARRLGLEVSTRAPMAETIERIRGAIRR